MIRSTFAIATLLIILPALAAIADTTPDSSVEERLRRLEEGFEQMRKVNDALLAENESLRRQLDLVAAAVPPAPVAPPAVQPAGKSAKLQLGGFVQVQGEAGDELAGRIADDNDRIFVRRARVAAGGNFTEQFDYRLEAEFAGSLGNASGMRAQMTDGYVTFTRWPAAAVRAGQFKTPFGFEQLYSDTKLLTPERSGANDLLTIGRQLGVQIAGDLAERRVSYSVGAFNGVAQNSSANDNDNFLVAARLSSFLIGDASSKQSIRASINGYTSEDDAVLLGVPFGFDSTPSTPADDNLFAGTRTGWGIDTQLVAGRAELWAEYLATEFEPDNGVPADRFTASGWYAQAGWYAIPSKLQLVGKYETTDPSDAIDGDDVDVWWLGANWYVKSHDVKLQLFYGFDEGPGAGDGSGRVIARVQTMF